MAPDGCRTHRAVIRSSAATVAQALDCLDGKAYLILDMNLPDGVGLTVLQKARIENPAIKTVVYSGTDDAALMDAVAEHHPDHVFRKPVMMGEIIGWLDAQSRPPDDTSPQPRNDGDDQQNQ